MHVVIVANAPAVDVAPYRSLIQAADRLIAADGGGTALFREGYAPSLLIGDLDSIIPEALAAYQAQGVVIERHRPDKDETDLELALLAAARDGGDPDRCDWRARWPLGSVAGERDAVGYG